jgi:hypothetical protein
MGCFEAVIGETVAGRGSRSTARFSDDMESASFPTETGRVPTMDPCRAL